MTSLSPKMGVQSLKVKPEEIASAVLDVNYTEASFPDSPAFIPPLGRGYRKQMPEK